MNHVTATFYNLDIEHLDQYIIDSKFYDLKFISMKGCTRYVTLEMRGLLSMINAFDKWVTDPKNWTEKALKGTA